MYAENKTNMESHTVQTLIRQLLLSSRICICSVYLGRFNWKFGIIVTDALIFSWYCPPGTYVWHIPIK